MRVRPSEVGTKRGLILKKLQILAEGLGRQNTKRIYKTQRINMTPIEAMGIVARRLEWLMANDAVAPINSAARWIVLDLGFEIDEVN